jgi:4-hydroxy-tetrahydrodipicolinate synthase
MKGNIVALITPMDEQGAVDFEALRNLLIRHRNAGTQGIVISGSTGEATTLTDGEREQLIRAAKTIVGGSIPVIAGTGASATSEALRLTQMAKQQGADACLIVTPAYNKPTQEGLFRHYAKIAQSVDIPIILYNVPSRTACDLLPETIVRLLEFPNIMGLKEALPGLERFHQLKRLCGDRLAVYSGDDETATELMLAGATGVISVTANVAPREMRLIYDQVQAGNEQTARDLDRQLLPLHQTLFVESNPIPVKWSLKRLGWISSDMLRLPLTPLSVQHQGQVEYAMSVALRAETL